MPKKPPFKVAATKYDLVIIDIETWPREREWLEQFAPEADAEFTPTEFDPAAVKYGNIKDEEKRAEKLKAAQAAHESKQAEAAAKAAASVEEKREQFFDRAALNPLFSRVFGFTIQDNPTNPLIRLEEQCPDDETERAIIFQLLQAMNDAKERRQTCAGWNSFGFDFPFIITRARLLGVEIPFRFRVPWYHNEWLADIQQEWSMNPREFSKLDLIGRVCGFGGKVDLGKDENGNKVLPWHLARDGQMGKLHDYTVEDGMQTWRVAELCGFGKATAMNEATAVANGMIDPMADDDDEIDMTAAQGNA